MADRPFAPDTGDHTGVEPGRRSTTGLPRWAKVSGFIVGVLVWAFVLMPFVFVPVLGTVGPGGSRGHGPGGSPGGDTPGVTPQQETNPDNDGGHTPPPGIPDQGG